MVPHDPRRQRVRDRPGRGRLLAQPVRARARARPLLPRRATARAGRPLRPAGHRGDRGGARASSRSGSAAAGSSGSAPRRASSSSGASSRRGFWYTKHPFSLSEAPNGDSFRITVKNLGDHSSRLGRDPGRDPRLRRGPVRGLHRPRAGSRRKALLIAGGIGITPVRALLERIDGDLVVLYRVVSSDEIVFADELDRIAADTRRARRVRGRRPPSPAGPRPALAAPSRASSSPTSPNATSTSAGRPA